MSSLQQNIKDEKLLSKPHLLSLMISLSNIHTSVCMHTHTHTHTHSKTHKEKKEQRREREAEEMCDRHTDSSVWSEGQAHSQWWGRISCRRCGKRWYFPQQWCTTRHNHHPQPETRSVISPEVLSSTLCDECSLTLISCYYVDLLCVCVCVCVCCCCFALCVCVCVCFCFLLLKSDSACLKSRNFYFACLEWRTIFYIGTLLTVCMCVCACMRTDVCACVCVHGCVDVGCVLFWWCGWVSMLTDVCQCCCLLCLYVYRSFFLLFFFLNWFGLRHFPCCKTWWIKNLNLRASMTAHSNQFLPSFFLSFFVVVTSAECNRMLHVLALLDIQYKRGKHQDYVLLFPGSLLYSLNESKSLHSSPCPHYGVPWAKRR